MPLDPERHYARNRQATCVISAGHAIWFLPGETAMRSAVASPASIERLWELLGTPTSGSAMAARIASDSDPAALGSLLDRLVAETFVLRGTPEELTNTRAHALVPASGERAHGCNRLVLGVTGAVQAVFVAPIIQRLAGEFARGVDVILTRGALRFVTPDAVAALGGTPWHDVFERRPGVRVPHAELAAAADLVLVLPASANSIFRLAQGSCNDLLSLIVAGTQAPLVVAPSMSPTMWAHPAVQRNVARIREDGGYIISPGPGRSAATDTTSSSGGVGLGGDSANLVGVLREVLEVSR